MAGFRERVAEAARLLRTLPEPLLLVGHLDTDGLCATAILSKALDALGVEYRTHIVPQLSPAFLSTLPEAGAYVFLDGGSAMLDTLPSPSLVVDHHQSPHEERADVFLLNPVLDGLDGARDACSSTVSWLLASALGRSEDSWMAVVGAIGDAHDKGGLVSLNKEAADAAVADGSAEVVEAPWLFGVFSQPAGKVLANSRDLRLPGVTGARGGAMRFLEDAGLDPGVRIVEYSPEERARLVAAVEERKPGAGRLIAHYGLFAPGPLRDARQYATFLNACGRMDRAELGLSMLRGESEEDPSVILGEYRRLLNEAVSWYEAAGEPAVTRSDGLVVIDARDRVPPAIAGTLCSVLTRGRMVPSGTVVLALARYRDGLTKVSCRGRDVSYDLLSLVSSASEAVGGEHGGHRTAAGAIVSSASEASFVGAFRRALEERRN